MIRPLHDSILFTFLDQAGSKGFSSVSEAGIIIKTAEDSLNSPRWGKVLATGPKVTDVLPGQVVLIEALRWTEGFKHDGITIWRTLEKDIMAIRDTQ